MIFLLYFAFLFVTTIYLVALMYELDLPPVIGVLFTIMLALCVEYFVNVVVPSATQEAPPARETFVVYDRMPGQE